MQQNDWFLYGNVGHMRIMRNIANASMNEGPRLSGNNGIVPGNILLPAGNVAPALNLGPGTQPISSQKSRLAAVSEIRVIQNGLASPGHVLCLTMFVHCCPHTHERL